MLSSHKNRIETMTKAVTNLACSITQLRDSVRRRIELSKTFQGESDYEYWEDAVGTKHAEEAVDVCETLLDDEAHLERILVARKHDETLSVDLFFEQVAFRAKYRPLEIDPETVSTALPSGAWRLCGYTKQGHVVSNYKLHLWDAHAYDDDTEEAVEEYVRYVLYMIELMIGSMKEQRQFVVLFDLSGFYVSLAFYKNVRLMIRKLIYVAQAQYPERLHKALLINAPYGFQTAWKMIRPLLDEKTASKIQFVSNDKLFNDISPDVLCVDYGGTHAEYPLPSKHLKDELSWSQHCEEPVNDE